MPVNAPKRSGRPISVRTYPVKSQKAFTGDLVFVIMVVVQDEK